MTTEELLRPRYKVIAKVPLNRHKVGDIILGDGDWYSTHRSQVDVSCSAFPDVYKPLEWWQDRDKNEMPKYVMFNVDLWQFKKGEVVEVFNWYDYPNACIFHNHYSPEMLLPSTLDEYTQYTNKQKQS